MRTGIITLYAVITEENVQFISGDHKVKMYEQN